MKKDKKKPNRINQNRLVRIFKDVKRVNSEDIRFCFLIGAGASKSSGIPTGWELARQWYNDLKDDLSDTELKEWKKGIKFIEKRIGEFYPQLYKKRYETSPQVGYDEFKQMMENTEPDLGYIILSQILANEKHNFVITTNFDYLIEDAVRMYTSTKPFSAGHETLAGFVSSLTERPTIIKVHRDLFLHPFNNEDDTQKLKEEWKKALQPILKNFNLLVIGYGGNDGSLMDYLNEIKPEDRKGIYWCIRNEKELNGRINKLLTDKDYIVNITGFDELMHALYTALDYSIFKNLDNPDTHKFVQASRSRIISLNEKFKKILENIEKDKKEIPQETKDMFSGASEYRINAISEKDNDKKEEIYKEGLNRYPKDTSLIHSYIKFLTDIRKDYDLVEEYYEKLLKINPKDLTTFNNYAVFLNKIRKDYERAEDYYKKSLKIDTISSTVLANYAYFLYNIRKDYEHADEYYQKSLELEQKDTYALGSYAYFLYTIRKDYDRAEKYYQRTLELEQKNVYVLGKYANFLYIIRKDNDRAEEYFKKSIKEEEKGINLNDYGVFLTDIRKDFEKAKEYFQKSIIINPEDANTKTNLAANIIIHKQNFKTADKLIIEAYEILRKNNVGIQTLHDEITLVKLWFYRYAHYAKYQKQAEKELNKFMKENVNLFGRNFQDHVEIAKENDHPDIKKLQEFADFFTKE